jgi:aminoethylphosphonate catabolism LysR family transcriptional regulator
MSGLTLLAALKAFDATARAGSMTAAARELGLQQPTLSAHIQRLEKKYGVELFHRRGRRLELTAFGATLLEYTRRTFSAEEDAHALLAAARSRHHGRLNILAIGPYNVVPIIKAYRRKHPLVSIAVGVGDSRSITEKILDYQGDVGVILNAADDPYLHCMPYRKQPLVIFASASHPLARQHTLAIKDLENQEFVMREEGSTTRRVFEEALMAHGVKIRMSLEMGSREAVREAVAQGLGLGIVAQTAYIPDPRLVQLSVSDVTLATHAHLICRRERQQVPLIDDFFQIAAGLRDRAQGHARGL